MKYRIYALYILGLLPFAFTASVLAFYLHAASILGHAPSYDNPDPKELAIYVSYFPWIEATFVIWLLSLIAWVVCTASYLILGRKNIRWEPIVLGAIGQSIPILMLFSEIMEWYVD